AACCSPDEDGQGGVALFPGEEALIGARGWAKVGELPGGGLLLTCDGACDRSRRPLGCMIFPLTPRFVRGELRVRIDCRSRPMCPLAPGGVRALRPEFVAAVAEALRLIASDPEGEAFLRAWEAVERQYRFRL
ncbi:MAG: hypothetical protein GX558_04185, partial [Clostridiales bacterium]|nr:hypothetical protein [Clostridiales bacterium]